MDMPNKVVVKQEVEMAEVFTGFETKNKYSINTETGEQLLFAYEESNTFKRIFLKRMRPLVIHIIDNSKNELVSLKKPFALFLPNQKVFENEKEIASIKKEFTLVKNKFNILYKGQNYLCTSTPRHPWTFNVFQDSRQIATIQKKWSGVRKEMFTSADTFFVDFGTVSDAGLKKIILCLSFAIDLTVFERKR